MTPEIASLKDRFGEFDELFRARELRERVMLACIVAAGIFFVIDTMAIQPVDTQRAQIELSTERTQLEIGRLEQEAKSLTNVVLTVEQRRARAELEQLQRQLAEIDSQMGSQIADLIPPRAIVSVLEELLTGDSNLKLLKLESQAPVRLGQDESSPVSNAGLGLYRHGLRIEIEGDFSSTLSYLRRLEGSRWNLLWDRFLLESPNFRAYVVDTPITFFCDLGDASLWRIAGYAITGSQPLIRTALPLSAGQSARASDRIESCSFDYVAGTPTRSGLVTIEIVLESADERVRLLQQVQVQNAP